MKIVIKYILSTGLQLSLGSALLTMSQSSVAAISQSPLLLTSGNVPGNLALVPSVEFPTVISIANIGNYNNNSIYTGYFDSAKCYDYIEESINHPYFGHVASGKASGGGYFTPVNTDFEKNKSCAGKWSGNYLNWATTQTIDPFRKALTGGYRVLDIEGKTILEKATRASRSSYFGERRIDSADLAKKLTPYKSAFNGSLNNGNNYQKNKTLNISNDYYSVRVEVCKAGLLEDNCKPYKNYWKPEGLIQEYSNDIKYSVLSYLNIDGNNQKGGVLRSAQKFVGEKTKSPNNPNPIDNANKEWDPITGILKPNPDDGAENSGVINYINKFGELTNTHKSNDPVSELYYAALRYFHGAPNVSSWSSTTNEAQKDKFPVITDWSGKDPIQYACQKNVILGIGDVNTHSDHVKPQTSDKFPVGADVIKKYTDKVLSLEGTGKTSDQVPFNGNSNSAHIAGLAYYANTNDIRSDFAGKQTISTYWVDVREDQVLKGKNDNQYWLAAKYGGFKVPSNYSFGTSLQSGWWNSGDTLQPNSGPAMARPNNFFVASDATRMVEGLKQAFAQIASEIQITTTSLASNSTRLDTNTAVFQSRVDSRDWSGDLYARKVLSSGQVESSPTWSASEKLNKTSYSNRNIFTTSENKGIVFSYSSLSTEQKDYLKNPNDTNKTLEARINYLRGDRTNEKTDTDKSKLFRQRGSVLGDIVNSDPQYVHNQDYGYSNISWSTSGSSIGETYKAFREANKNRKPFVLVGANDGMLHAFDATLGEESSGKELFAFIPNAVIPNLKNLSDPNYIHRYYVDGTPRVADAWLGASIGWKTLAVGSTGAGGKSIFALDVTNPNSMSKDNVLWEFTHANLGYTIGQPAIVALPNGKFAVIVTSGYNESEPTSAHVWALDAADGRVISQIELKDGGNLGTPLVVDLDNNKIADFIYAGDTKGNLWKIKISSNGSLEKLPLLFTTKGGRPITSPLTSALDKDGKHVILFGTGSFYKVGDNEIPITPSIEALYGIIDQEENKTIKHTNLLKQKIIKQDYLYDQTLRAVSNEKMTSNHKGWYLELVSLNQSNNPVAKGERVVAKADVRSDRVIFTTFTPSADPCAYGGSSTIFSIDLASGSRLNYTFFDINKDGVINDGDILRENGQPDIPWSGTSDASDGVIKGVTSLYKWLCFAGSSGNPRCIPVAGSQRFGRNSWHEVRSDD